MICFLPLLNEIAECDVVNFFVQKYLKKKKKSLLWVLAQAYLFIKILQLLKNSLKNTF